MKETLTKDGYGEIKDNLIKGYAYVAKGIDEESGSKFDVFSKGFCGLGERLSMEGLQDSNQILGLA